MISKNGLIAALWTAAIVGVFAGLMMIIKNYPDLMWYVISGLIGLGFFAFCVYPLWDTIKYELDKRDECKIELDFDEDDKAQIG